MSFFARRHLAKLSSRVKRGAALLDAEIPGWETRIDLDRLNIATRPGCVLGQLVDSSTMADTVALQNIHAVSFVRHGFVVDRLARFFCRSGEDYQTLTLMWAAEILIRRRAASRRLVAPPRANTPVLV